MARMAYSLKDGTNVEFDSGTPACRLVEELLVDVSKLRAELEKANKEAALYLGIKRNADRYEWRMKHESPKMNIRMVTPSDIEGQDAVRDILMPFPSWEEMNRYIDQDLALIRQKKLD